MQIQTPRFSGIFRNVPLLTTRLEVSNLLELLDVGRVPPAPSGTIWGDALSRIFHSLGQLPVKVILEVPPQPPQPMRFEYNVRNPYGKDPYGRSYKDPLETTMPWREIVIEITGDDPQAVAQADQLLKEQLTAQDVRFDYEA